MLQTKKLGGYLQAAEDLLFGRDETLTITDVRTRKAIVYGSLMPNPFVLAQLILTTGHAPTERKKEVNYVEVTAQNDAGEKFWRDYQFSNPERAAGFARTMGDYQKGEEIVNVHITSRRNRLPWYLPLIA